MSFGLRVPTRARLDSARARPSLTLSWIRTLAVCVPPSVASALVALLALNGTLALSVSLCGVLLALLLGGWLHARDNRHLRTLSSVLDSYREGDFSIRARAFSGNPALDQVLSELNRLGDELRRRRLGELEAWLLLRKVLAELDAVVMAFDELGYVRMANEAAARILHRSTEELLGQASSELALSELLSGSAPRIVDDTSMLGGGSWELRRGNFQLAGQRHTLMVLSDVSDVLREREREAWKRLIRVMGHEINNSLAPIQSLAQNLGVLLRRTPRDPDLDQDLEQGLSIIGRRAEGLGRFMTAYSKLARLPPPVLGSVEVEPWITRVIGLEQRVRVRVDPGPAVSLLGDQDQLDQLLINLLKNAAEATLETGSAGEVRVSWALDEGALEITLSDDGPGVRDTANLFVPFFTTKPGGSGIGLALARQIAEAHGGEVELSNRADNSGADARVRLPLRTLG